MIDEQDQQSKTVNQNDDERQSNGIRNAIPQLALSANDRCALMVGYGPPPNFAVPVPGRDNISGDSSMNGAQQRLPQNSERMGFIYGPPSTLNDANQVATCEPVNPDCVVVLTYIDGDGNVFERTLNRHCTQITIGREEKCDLTLHDVSVSRIHAFVNFINGRVFVKQAGNPSNGTKVNGVRLVREMPLELTDGSEIVCGRILIKVSILD